MPYKINSLYLHFPFCAHLCNYCDFFKSVPENKPEELTKFEHYLEQTYQVHEKFLASHDYFFGELETFYMGGGTPSLWSERGANFLHEFLNQKGIKLQKNGEHTLEVNPGGWNEEGLSQFLKFGINRFSLGIQSLDARFLKVLDRYHDLNHVHETLEYFSKNDFNFSVDFMLGLPFSEEYKRDIEGELKEILKYKPKHLSIYILTTKTNYVHKNHLPSEEWIETEYLKVSEFLRSHGYLHYEVSNFSLPNFESKHNLKYWETTTVAALGPSATGYLNEVGIRYKWKPYKYELETENLTSDQKLLEEVYLNLRCFKGFDWKNHSTKSEKWILLSERWNDLGYLTSKSPIKLSPKGYLMMDSLMDEIFKENIF